MRRSSITVAILAVHLSAAHAQEERPLFGSSANLEAERIASDVASIQACLNGVHSRADKIGCIGTIVTSCEKEPSKEPVSIQTYFCRSREASVWDRLLNENFKHQIQSIQNDDLGDGRVKTKQLEILRVAQRLWVQFRDAEMERMEANSQGAASTWILANVEFVRLDMTAQRAIELE